MASILFSWWTFRIFLIFVLLGEAPGGGGGRISIENPRRRGGVLPKDGRGPRGWEGVCGELGGGGGGLNIFLGAEFPNKLSLFKCA